MPKGWIFIFFVILLLFPIKSLAVSDLILYKFSSFSSPDWIEIKNISEESISLNNYSLEDEAGNRKTNFDCFLNSGGIYAVDFSNWLNNGGDAIYLKDVDGVIDCAAYGDSECPGENPLDFEEDSDNKYGIWNGVSWEITDDSGKAENSACEVLQNTPVVAPTQVNTPTVSSSGNFKINEAKDSDGGNISNAKIYVDDVYTHHYAPEDLGFCDGCDCNSGGEASCGYGQHNIRLTKDGYQDW
ncbi:MAG: lamin tail domain-containing protein [Candidatus Shapirobacteria bacterium]